MGSYDLVFNIHRFVSAIFIIITIIILVRSYRGRKFKTSYTNFDKNIAALFLVFLYIQLVLGVLLYFGLGKQSVGAASFEETVEKMSLRFWALEHSIVMMFALFLSQLGWIFIRKSKLDLNKHKNTLFYFGISILLIIISTGIGLIWR